MCFALHVPKCLQKAVKLIKNVLSTQHLLVLFFSSEILALIIKNIVSVHCCMQQPSEEGEITIPLVCQH